MFQRKHLQASSLIIGCIALSVSSWFLSLWLIGNQDQYYWVAHNMKSNTAVGLILSSLAIICYSWPRQPQACKRGGLALSVLVFLIGALTMIEYVFNINLGIDQLIAPDPAQDTSLLYPGRMAPNTALAFILMGLGLIYIDVRTRRGYYVSDGLFTALAILVGTALIGYAYESAAFYQFSIYLRISQYTSAIFLVLVIAAFLVRPEHPPAKLFFATGAEGQTVRIMFPAAILLPIVILGFTMRMRELEVLSRPTGYSVAAILLIVVFSYLAWRSAMAVAISERERRRLFNQERATWQVMNKIGQTIFAELDQQKLVQAVTDAATRLSGAQFGAFFYTMTNERGDSFQLYTISGVPREMFSKFPMPRSTKVFEPTFLGQGIVRSDDITKDPRYGHNKPYHGMPTGHLPVRSYLAVPVVNRDGKPVGGLFFGHSEVGVFTEQAEKIVEGLAVQAAVAMDNATLYGKLQQSVTARDEFLSIASHELKTPLTTLKLQSQIRERYLNKGDFSKFSSDNLIKMFTSDRKQIDRIVRLVDDMLDIGRINSGKLGMTLENFDLCELARDVVERIRAQYQDAKVELNFDCAESARVHADRHRIEQVLVNLLSNALKYGDGKPVTVKLYSRAGRVFTEVIDRGIGIAPKDHKLIFGRFERAVEGTGISGLGLGLFIVKQIIEGHQGQIHVVSDLGEGSKFTFDLPERREQQQELQ